MLVFLIAQVEEAQKVHPYEKVPDEVALQDHRDQWQEGYLDQFVQDTGAERDPPVDSEGPELIEYPVQRFSCEVQR